MADLARRNPFERVPAEVRVMIYKLHLQLDEPVKLMSDGDSDLSRGASAHLRRCMHGIHTWISCADNLNSAYFKPVLHCQSPFNLETTIIKADESVLAILQVCKQFYQEASPLFYEVNEFHFLGPADIMDVISRMDPTRSAEIRNITFAFRSHGAGRWARAIAEALPKLKIMNLLIEVGKPGITLRMRQSLRFARGVPALRNAFQHLTHLNLFGFDRLQDAQGKEVFVHLDDEGAVGPWLREKMVEKSKDRIERLDKERKAKK